MEYKNIKVELQYMKRPKFVENEIYHIYNRGVEKRDIFINDRDYLRFIHDLFEFNDKNATFNFNYHINSKTKLRNINRHIEVELRREPRKLLVEIMVFTLMPNHFHLLLRQKTENGIVKFMQKLGTGYTNFFNKKYDRVGSLFQGRFKAIHINKEDHFIHLPFYIHANPLDLIYRSSTSIDWEFLEDYRWSSLLDYIGIKNFPSITSREFLLDFWDGKKKYKETFQKWIQEKNTNIEKIKDAAIEVELR